MVHHEGLAGPGGWVAAAPELPIAVLGAARRGSSMCPDRLILYTKCPFRACPVRIMLEFQSGHTGVPLACALKNRAYGASVPAGGVCLQGQFYGTSTLT